MLHAARSRGRILAFLAATTLAAVHFRAAGSATPVPSPVWPSKFVARFVFRSGRPNHWKVVNRGRYWYDWDNGKRMLIESANCSGGASGHERRDIQCDGVFRDGKLYAKGVWPLVEGLLAEPWCCLWHDEMWPTPPYFLDHAELVDAATSFDGVPAAKHAPYLKGASYTRLDDGLPLALDSGFGAHFLFSNVAKGHPMGASRFDLPTGRDCEAKCDWAALPFESEKRKRTTAAASGSASDSACPVPKAERTSDALDNPHCPAAWNHADREA